jgi:hypothetical protein
MSGLDEEETRGGTPTLTRRLVTVASYPTPIEAHLARGRLEAEGLTPVLADEHLVALHGLATLALGGVKLQVPSEEAARARRALAEVAAPLPRSARYLTADLDAPRCPACGSLGLAPAAADRRSALLAGLLLGLPLLLGRARGLRCRDCGTRRGSV